MSSIDNIGRRDTYGFLIQAEHPEKIRYEENPMPDRYFLSSPVQVPLLNTLTGQPELDENDQPITRTAYDEREVTLDDYKAAEVVAGIEPNPLAPPAEPATNGFHTDGGVRGRTEGGEPVLHSAVLPTGQDYCDRCGRTEVLVPEGELFRKVPVTLTPVGLGRFCSESIRSDEPTCTEVVQGLVEAVAP